MRLFDAQLSQTMRDEDVRSRIKTFLSDAFDPVVLNRPTFLDEVGLRPEDGILLRHGSFGYFWLRTHAFERALAEEIRAEKGTLQRFLENYADASEEAQWRTAQKVFLRLEQLVLAQDRDKVAAELGMAPAQLDELRKRWKTEVGSNDQALAVAIQLQLLGVGRSLADLVPAVDAQTTKHFLFIPQARPTLTHVSDEDAELVVAYPAGNETLLVRKSMVEEIAKNSKCGAEMWAKQWVDYFQKHGHIQNQEFQAFLHHLEDGERYKWPNLVAGQGAKARRGVAAVANALLEALHDTSDQTSLQKLFDRVNMFSEKHEMEAILKRRFGV